MPVAAVREAPRTVHLLPRADGWILVAEENGERGTHFEDLARALDAATRGARPVHVVVHGRGAA